MNKVIEPVDSKPSRQLHRPTEISFMSWIETCKPLPLATLNNHICEIMGEWLLSQASQSGNKQLRNQQALSIWYLFDCTLSNCSSSCLSTLLLNISILPSSFEVMKALIQRLPSTYFQKNYKSIIKSITKLTLDVPRSPTKPSSKLPYDYDELLNYRIGSPRPLPKHKRTSDSSSSSASDFGDQLMSERDKRIDNVFLFGTGLSNSPPPSPEPVTPQRQIENYDERKDLIVLLLKRMQGVMTVEVRD